MTNGSDKLPSDFEKPELLSLLKRFLDIYEKNSRESLQSAEQAARINTKKLMHGFFGLGISILIAASSFFVSKYFEESRHKREAVQAEIQRRLTKLEEISVALTEVRKVKDDVLIKCATESMDKREIAHRRLEARTNLIKAVRNADFYFGNNVYSEITSFVDWENSINDYCSNELPNDKVWREKHRKIETLMREYFPKETFVHENAQ